MGLENLTSTGNIILDPFVTLFYSFLSVLPSIILALLIVILGYAVAYLVGWVTRWVIEKGVGKQLKATKLSKAAGQTNWSSLVGELVKWFVFIIFLTVAVDVLNLSTLSDLLGSFVRWLPNVLFAVIILFAGLALVHYVDMKMKAYTKMKGMGLMRGIVKVVLIFLIVLITLGQIGVNVRVLQQAFLILVGALGLGFALALGIGLGLGLREPSTKWVKDFQKKF